MGLTAAGEAGGATGALAGAGATGFAAAAGAAGLSAGLAVVAGADLAGWLREAPSSA